MCNIFGNSNYQCFKYKTDQIFSFKILQLNRESETLSSLIDSISLLFGTN